MKKSKKLLIVSLAFALAIIVSSALKYCYSKYLPCRGCFFRRLDGLLLWNDIATMISNGM